jgi:hypothetical protein
VAIERVMRDFRINLIFEGSSEIMHLFMAREAVDRHLQAAGDLIDPDKSMGEKLRALPRIVGFYAGWYPTRWLGWGRWPRFSEFGALATHMRFVERSCRKLARQTFHGMVVHGPRLQRKQAFLFRLVDVTNELFAMAACLARARQMRLDGSPDASAAERVVDLFCRGSRARVRAALRGLWRNHDAFATRVSREVLAGEHAWLETDVLGRIGQDEPERATSAVAGAS